MTKRIILSFFILALTALPLCAADAPQLLTRQDVFKYLDQTIVWYHDITTMDVSDMQSREIVLHNNLKQNALKALRRSFDFARIEAGLLDAQEQAQKQQDAAAKKELSEQTKENTDGTPTIEQFKIALDRKITRIENDIRAANTALRRENAANRIILKAKLEKLNGEMTLAKAQQELIGTITDSTDTDNDEITLQAQIDNLAKSIPELEKKKKAVTPAPTAETTTVTTTVTAPSPAQTATALATMTPLPTGEEKPVKEVKGIIGLGSDILDVIRQRQNLRDMTSHTKTMLEANEKMRFRLRDNLIAIVNRSNELAVDENGHTVAAYQGQRDELAALTGQFRSSADVIVPLVEQKKPLEAAVSTLDEWQSLFAEEMNEHMSGLIFRVAGLVIAILIPLAFSEFARRATLKYVVDSRRRRQLNLIRRIVVSIIIGLIVILNLMTEFGSMATFVGFVTAGLAVALQNVILSAVAYFFFFGRYGIRAGSRVTVYGTTGEVIETGLVRLYLMELSEVEGKWQPTGRIVAFPNSILFQPTAFFKQVPGVKFNQHEATFMIESDTDRAIANAKLKEAADAVFEDSRAVLEVQKSALEKSTHIKAKIPRPKGVLRDEGTHLAFVVRYPVAADKGGNIDENAARIISEVLERDPKIHRIDDDPPTIKSIA